MPIGAAIGGAAVIGGVATSSAAKKNAKAATTVADQNNALQRQIYDQNRSNMTPYIDGGSRSFSTWQDLMGISDNPEEASRRGYEAFKGSLGYDSALAEGTRSMNALLGKSGMYQSGAAVKAAGRYGQDYANTFAGDYLNRLMSGTQIGVSATNALAGASTAFGNTVSNNNNAALNATTAANTAAGNALAGFANNAAGAFAYGYGNDWGKDPSSRYGTSYQVPEGAVSIWGRR